MYGEIYFHNYCINEVGDTARLSIRKKDYLGPATFVDAGPIPFEKSLLNNEENLLGEIYPTHASLQLIGDENFGMDDIFTANDSEFQIIHLINNEIDWIGFLTPESFGEDDTNGVRYLDIKAFDGLTRLKGLKFIDPSGVNYGTVDENYEKSLLFAVKECLKKTGLELNILSLVDRLPIEANGTDSIFVIDKVENGFIYSPQFVFFDELIVIGNYLYFKEIEGNKYTNSIIEEIDLSNPSWGKGIKLNPQYTPDPVAAITGYFYTPIYDQNLDPLAISTHDVRVWVNPETTINKENQDDVGKKYYEYTDGTLSSWDVLNNIALLFDCRVSQEKGKWIFESLDKHRIEQDYFEYDFDGNYLNRFEKSQDSIIPCEHDEINYKASGNTRYIDKTLKSVSVGYQYRYKAEGDNLTNLIRNGKFEGPNVPMSPTYTPDGWVRESSKWGISINLGQFASGQPFGNFLQMATPNEFNSFNWIRPVRISMLEGDVLRMSWWQSIKEFSSNANRYNYVTIVVELKTKDSVYYLVNHEDEKGWSDINYMSANPIGSWKKKENSIVWHFNTNYSTGHNPTPAGNFSDFSKVNIKSEGLPDDGEITIKFVGSAFKMLRTGATGSPMYDKDKFAHAMISTTYDTENEKLGYEEWSENHGQLMTFYKGEFNPEIKIADVQITKIANKDIGIGRLYEYIQDGDYFDKLDDVTVLLGDEENNDHLSVIRVGGKVVDKWITRDNSLQICPIGLTLAKSIQRRYLKPKKLMDGGLSTYPINLNGVIQLGDYPNTKWFIKAGDIQSKEHRFGGTICQYVDHELPDGGNDYGENSISSNSNKSNSNVSSGASQSWVSAQSYVKSSDSTLDKTLQRGNESTLPMKVRGTRNTHLLAIPEFYVNPNDEVPGEIYLHSNGGYVYINGVKCKVGDSDKWDGRSYDSTFDQGLKTTDNVEHNSIKTTSLEINGELGLNVTKRIKLADDTIEDWFFESGRLVRVEVV